MICWKGRIVMSIFTYLSITWTGPEWVLDKYHQINIWMVFFFKNWSTTFGPSSSYLQIDSYSTFWVLCCFKRGKSSVPFFFFFQLVAHVFSPQWHSPSFILFMFNSFYFWTLFKYKKAFNLPMRNVSHSRFVSPAKFNVVLTIPSCRSLAETWNTNILKSKSRRNPLVMFPPAPLVDTDLLIILLRTASVITQWITPAIYQDLWSPKESQMMY